LESLTADEAGVVEHTDPNPPAGKVFYRLSTP
jgi:hypothetical protein